MKKLIALTLWAALAYAGPILSIQPSTNTVGIGDHLTAAVNIAGVVDLYAQQFDLSFDPSVLRALIVSPGAFLSGGVGFIPGLIDNTAGTILFTADILSGAVPGISGDGILASIEFTALGAGTSSLTLSNVVLLDSNLADIPVGSVLGGAVSVAGTATPEPAFMVPVAFCLVLAAGRVRGQIG